MSTEADRATAFDGDRAEASAEPPGAAPAASRALAGLLGVAEAERFLGDAFGRDAWRGRLAPGAAEVLFDWPRLNAALAEHRLPAGRLKLERGGRPVPSSTWRARSGAEIEVEGLLRELRGGATLILDAAHEISPPLARLCADLSADFTCYCAANLYASWGETQGFDVHWDDHEVIVVQAQGRKRWSLYGRTRAAPVVRDDPTDHRPPAEPLEDFVLEQGDALYLPRGYWHAAVGRGEPSLHLTIGLTRRTGSEFLHWLADRLLSEEAVRTDLPFERGDSAVAAQLGGLLAEAARRDPLTLARDYRRHVEAALPHRPRLSLPALGEGGLELQPDDRLTLADGAVRLDPGPSPDLIVLSWRGTRFTLDAVLAPVIRALCAGGSIRVADVRRCTSEAQADSFVREMIARGVLLLRPAGIAQGWTSVSRP